MAQYDNPTGVVSVPNTSSIGRNPEFTDYVLHAVNNPNSAQFSAAVRVTEPGVSPDANNRIWLGSFTFQVAGNVGSSTLIRAIDIPNDNTTTTGLTGGQGFQELDALIAGIPSRSSSHRSRSRRP